MNDNRKLEIAVNIAKRALDMNDEVRLEALEKISLIQLFSEEKLEELERAYVPEDEEPSSTQHGRNL
jgi:HEAT repeat protein